VRERAKRREGVTGDWISKKIQEIGQQDTLADIGGGKMPVQGNEGGGKKKRKNKTDTAGH